jgi:hypothetical protein
MLNVLFAGCHSRTEPPKPSLEISHVPPRAAGGPEQMDFIAGRVRGATPGEQIVVYAKNDSWWVQPFKISPFTAIQADQTWKSPTHLGTDYAAVLVEPDYHPAPRIAELPREGNGVVAVLTIQGAPIASAVSKTIHFSGYDWIVRSAPSDRGGETNNYDSRNVWTDQKGYLHLRMGPQDDRWTCGEVNLTRSLGYGTYRFVIEDTTHFKPSGVLAMFTVDERRGDDIRVELDFELSQWGRPGSKNAQYVVQPYYIPENIVRFSLPSGLSTHVLRWKPGVASFNTYGHAGQGPGAKSLYEHAFTSGVPAAAAETVHMGLYDFFHSKSNLRGPVEVVIEKFEYLP